MHTLYLVLCTYAFFLEWKKFVDYFTLFLPNSGVFVTIFTKCLSQGIEFVALKREVIYEYEGSVTVLAQPPWDQFHLKPPQSSSWKIRGTVKLHRIDTKTLAASVRSFFL